METGDGNRKGQKPRTVRRRLSALSSLFSHLVQRHGTEALLDTPDVRLVDLDVATKALSTHALDARHARRGPWAMTHVKLLSKVLGLAKEPVSARLTTAYRNFRTGPAR